jgi:hypothetical protein
MPFGMPFLFIDERSKRKRLNNIQALPFAEKRIYLWRKATF